MFIVMAGMFFVANAQMCRTTGNVEPVVSSDGEYLVVDLHNYNDYKVTVTITATVVNTEGKEVVREKTVVVPRRGSKEYGEKKNIRFKGKGNPSVNKDESSVSIRVEMCD